MNKKNVKILICGQDTQTVEFLRGCLSDEGYTFEQFEEFEDAIEKLHPGEYHALILGLCQASKVGRLNGLRAIPILRKIDSNLPIIAIACDESLETERKARMAGVFYYLLQPLDVNELRSSVVSAIHKYERLI